MAKNPQQANFSKRVRLALVKKDLNVTTLAKLIGKRRDTVSTAIHNDRFPLVRAKIEEVLL